METRQVFDLPEKLIEVTEHQAAIYCCAACGCEMKAGFPEGVAASAQYGERVRAAVVYLNVQQLIPEDRVAQTMHDLFNAARARRPVHRAGSYDQGASRPERIDRDGLRLARLGEGQERWNGARLDTVLPQGP